MKPTSAHSQKGSSNLFIDQCESARKIMLFKFFGFLNRCKNNFTHPDLLPVCTTFIHAKMNSPIYGPSCPKTSKQFFYSRFIISWKSGDFYYFPFNIPTTNSNSVQIMQTKLKCSLMHWKNFFSNYFHPTAISATTPACNICFLYQSVVCKVSSIWLFLLLFQIH